MRKVFFVFAAFIALAACGNRQAAHEAESGETSNRAATDDTYANGISIEELFEVDEEEDSRKLKEILTRKGFAVDDNQDERYDCDSEKGKKTVYNPERTDSDTISVYWTSATI